MFADVMLDLIFRKVSTEIEESGWVIRFLRMKVIAATSRRETGVVNRCSMHLTFSGARLLLP